MHFFTTAVTPEAEVDAQAVIGFFDSLTLRKILPLVLVMAVGLVVIKLLLKLFDQALVRSNLERSAYGMLRSAMKVLLNFILMLVMAGQLGIDVTSLVAVLSVVSLAVSLAVQGALTNIVGGITLLATHPFKAGDYVEIGDQSGTVQDVSLTYTRLTTPDSKTVSIPNSVAAGARITNFTTAGTRRIDITVSASYDSPIPAVKEALLRAADTPNTMKDPVPFAGVREYGDSAITYVLQFWTTAGEYWPTFYAVNEAIAAEFDKNGLIMTYPHLNVHLDRAFFENDRNQ